MFSYIPVLSSNQCVSLPFFLSMTFCFSSALMPCIEGAVSKICMKLPQTDKDIIKTQKKTNLCANPLPLNYVLSCLHRSV
jgi:hypothetical protein